jgi:hypothetical protein
MSARGTRTVVPAPPGCAVPRYDADVIERCYEIWATAGAMSGPATVAQYALEVEPGTPIPTPRTIQLWAREHGWAARLDADLARNHGQRLYELQLRRLANYEAAEEETSRVLAGMYDENVGAGALRLKARELLERAYERGVRVALPKPSETARKRVAEMSDEEATAMMRELVTTRPEQG